MIRILMLCPNPNDATSYYRGIGPFTRLQKDHKDIAIYSTNEIDFANNWAAMASADIVFLQRPYHPQHVVMAEAAHRAGIRLWVDYDDDQFNLAFENPAYDAFMNQQSFDNVARCCKLADVVTVSTPPLKDVYGKFNDNVVVISNAIDEQVFGARPLLPREKIVVWRGAQGHGRDLDSVAKDLIEISHDPEFADWTFHFVGDRPWRLIEKMRDSHTHWSPSEPMLVYLEKLWQMRPAVMIVPLVDDKFNRAKSNIAALEAGYAGALPIVPDYLPEFDISGLFHYGSRWPFKSALQTAMRYEIKPLVEPPQLGQANILRNEIVSDLLAKPRGINWSKS